MTSVQEPVTVRTPLAADETEQATLRELRALLSTPNGESPLIVAGDRETAIPPTLLYLLRRLVEHLANERAVRMETFGQEVTPREAADILGDSVEHVRQLLAEDILVARIVNTDDVVNLQLIKLADLLAYQAQRAAQQTAAINELLRLSEEYGLYDRDIRVEDTVEGQLR